MNPRLRGAGDVGAGRPGIVRRLRPRKATGQHRQRENSRCGRFHFCMVLLRPLCGSIIPLMAIRSRAFLMLLAALFPAFAQHDHDAEPAVPQRFNATDAAVPESAWHVSPSHLVDQRRSAGLLQSGLSTDVCLRPGRRRPLFPRGREARPECAICYWAEAWSWGSYLNGPMQPSNAPYRLRGDSESRWRWRRAMPRAMERAFIEAMSVRYVKIWDPKKRHDTTPPTPKRRANSTSSFPKMRMPVRCMERPSS